ncbi:TPA: dihydromonapterin reductase, partial [Escherichia coli]|nr:dihydromonapterin reductase [Escherichia coli]
VLKSTHGLRAILHNASAWMAEKPGTPLADVLACMMQIHVNTPYLLNHALERLLRGHGHAASDIIHFTDYVVERGSDKHVAYAASKAALDNMTRSFARKLAPEVKVNSIAPSLILFNEHDDAEYRQQALNKSLMKTAPGEKEVIDLVDYLLTSCFVTGRSFPLDGGRHLR